MLQNAGKAFLAVEKIKQKTRIRGLKFELEAIKSLLKKIEEGNCRTVNKQIQENKPKKDMPTDYIHQLLVEIEEIFKRVRI